MRYSLKDLACWCVVICVLLFIGRFSWLHFQSISWYAWWYISPEGACYAADLEIDRGGRYRPMLPTDRYGEHFKRWALGDAEYARLQARDKPRYSIPR